MRNLIIRLLIIVSLENISQVMVQSLGVLEEIPMAGTIFKVIKSSCRLMQICVRLAC